MLPLLDPIILLPYYPPGANDPNDPNYDPEAPEDGSANPPWWSLPPRPEKPLTPAHPGADPSWMPLPSLIAGMWEDKLMAARPPMPPKDELWDIDLPSFKPNDHDLGPGRYEFIVQVYDNENKYSEDRTPFRVDLPVEVPGLGPINRMEDYIFPVESHSEGKVSVDANIGNVVRGIVELRNLTDLLFSATLHIPQDGGSLDIPLKQDANDPTRWYARLPADLNYPIFDSSLEYTLGDAPAETIDFPLLEEDERVYFDGGIEDIVGNVAANIQTDKMYRVHGEIQSPKPFRTGVLQALTGSSEAIEHATNVREWRFGKPITDFEFSFDVSGGEINQWFGADSSRWLGAALVDTGRSSKSGPSVLVPPPATTDRSIAESVGHYVDEYLGRGLGYGIDYQKRKEYERQKAAGEQPTVFPPYRDGKAKLEELDEEFGDGITDEDREADHVDFAGIDCSGFVFNIINYVRQEQGLEPLDEVTDTHYTNFGAGFHANEQFKELEYKPAEDAGSDPGNARIKDLKPGDFMYGRPGGNGHYMLVKEVVKNEDGTYDVTVAHSSGKDDATGKDGPHEYLIDDVDGEKGIHEVEPDEIDVGPNGPDAEYEADTLHDMSEVKRDKDLDEKYEEEESGG